ncbi:lipoprotein LpqH [Gordonia sp. (in: high G+C Gram-positive bacteria)]|uniref:lipoprotein LpqH n=1 Tax=Gordonia sp. (in: high G+C Gram-positive bacteria) TaxID=84139 RepID=UPI0039E28661
MGKRQISVLAAGAVLLVLPACSGDKKPVEGGEATVVVDGKNLAVAKNRVTCETRDGKVHIGIASDRENSGMTAVVTEGDKPELESVGLGDVDGVSLGFARGAGDGTGTATKTPGGYTLSGEATGYSMSNLAQPSRKHFEFRVTCP